MKADILGGFDEVKICTAYEIDGKRTTSIPANIRAFERAKPIYETFKGWKSLPSKVRSKEELPREFLEYVRYIEKSLGIPASVISLGPGRDETLSLV
jgi:adenylosuccinate synthase